MRRLPELVDAYGYVLAADAAYGVYKVVFSCMTTCLWCILAASIDYRDCRPFRYHGMGVILLVPAQRQSMAPHHYAERMCANPGPCPMQTSTRLRTNNDAGCIQGLLVPVRLSYHQSNSWQFDVLGLGANRPKGDPEWGGVEPGLLVPVRLLSSIEFVAV